MGRPKSPKYFAVLEAIKNGTSTKDIVAGLGVKHGYVYNVLHRDLPELAARRSKRRRGKAVPAASDLKILPPHVPLKPQLLVQQSVPHLKVLSYSDREALAAAGIIEDLLKGPRIIRPSDREREILSKVPAILREYLVLRSELWPN